ncbi:MAG: hypothetical protein IT384_20275 [Deltaproteobacteria bacterium]|nr:hypothetical protein [Deltaproteobacteria bacterium]
MAAAIRQRFPAVDVELIKGGKGNFIVTTEDGRQLWHKRQMGDEFPEESQILDQLTP